jgi:prevent-host-death family protein
MKIGSLADVKARLSAYVDKAESEGPVIITRNGKPAAVLLAPKDDEELERLVPAYSPRFQALLDKSRRNLKRGEGVSHQDFWRTVSKRSTSRRSRRSTKNK